MFPKGKDQTRVSIAVSEKIIADISTGIYRSAAGAMKELIANAYDADATEVRIETNAPNFDTLVVTDDGVGMTLARFLQVIQSIGGSRKRIDHPDELSEIFHRKLIGRIGIGLLAVAQLGQRFYVSSSVKGQKTRFLAEVDLRPFHKDDAALRRLGAGSADDDIEIGTVRYIDGLPEPESTHFTVITVPDPKAGLVSEMHSQLREVMGAEPQFTLKKRAKDFRKIVEAVQASKRADLVLDSYHHLAWELGLLCPVRYLDGGPFDGSKRTIEALETLALEEPSNFTVFFDRFDIRRPILFPNAPAVTYGGPDPIIYPISWQGKVAGRPLKFGGYIYSQLPHIASHELAGIQLRVRGVGVGVHDKTCMGYPFDEGYKFGQLSGEIYVQEGLESALNIDRASFRETDPHYLAIRAQLWRLLKEKVFPDHKSRQDAAKHNKDKKQLAKEVADFESALAEAPAPIGGSPRVNKPAASKPSPSKPQTSKTETSPSAQTAGAYQSTVVVVEGEAEVDQGELNRAADKYKLNKAAKQRLLRVAAALAAYGVWDNLTPKESRGLFMALAAGVRS